MAKKRHLSARGKEINFDELFMKNQKAVAVTGGGVPMNARGDRLGPGGKIVERVEEREKQSDPQMAQADMPYATENPKAVKMVSLKQNIDDLTKDKKTESKTKTQAKATASVEVDDDVAAAKTPQEVIKELSGQLDTVKSKSADKEEAPKEETKETNEEKSKTKTSSTSKRKIVDTDD